MFSSMIGGENMQLVLNPSPAHYPDRRNRVMTISSGMKHGFIKREFLNGKITIGNITPYPPDAGNKITDEYSWTEHIIVFSTKEEAAESHAYEVSRAAAVNRKNNITAL